MRHVIIRAGNREQAEARTLLYAPLCGVRTLMDFPADGNVDLADLSLLPVAALHSAIRDTGGRAKAVLLPPDAALPPDGERVQKLLVRNKLRGFIRNTLFLHPAVARVLEVADGGCVGNIRQIRIMRRITAHTVTEVPALEAWFARRYLPETTVRDALSEEPQTEDMTFAFIPVPKESEAGWELEITGTAGVLSAWAPYAGGGAVKLTRSGATLREWNVPAEHPGRLCLAAVLACLASGETPPFLDFKAATKSLMFLEA